MTSVLGNAELLLLDPKAFTPEVREAWTALYQVVATTMQAAAGAGANRLEPALAA